VFNIFSELKRRNVYRVAAFYIIVAWLVLQVVDVFMDFMPLPEWTGSLVFVLLMAGFPVALIMAWAFELTPDGIRPDTQGGTEGTRPARRGAWDLLLGIGVAAVIAWLAYGYLQPRDQEEQVTAGNIRSLVVLPLDNLMSDPDQAYFVEGMHDALITELSRIEALRTISRTSAMRYQNSQKPLPEIARELGVDAVVEGSVLRAGNTVRINVQLINAQADRHIWGEQFDRELTDILDLYSEVTRRITDQIRIQVSSAETAHLEQVRPVLPEVYDLYLKGTHLCDRWAPQDMFEGLDHLREATRQETGSALYHAALAICLQYTAYFDYLSPLTVRDEALAAANQAVVLNGQLDLAHVAKGAVHWYLDFDARSSGQSLKRALELNPTMVRALTHYSWLMGELGQTSAAVEAAKKALAADPFSASAHQALGQAHYLGRQFGLARKPFETALSLYRGDPSLYGYPAWIRELDGAFDEAIALCRTAVELSGNAPLYLSELGYMLGRAGRRDEAMEVLRQLQQMKDGMVVQPFHLVYLVQSVEYDPLGGDPRFQAVVNRIID
jgi:TolB-like protein/Flp pilus assembly protein TadD